MELYLVIIGPSSSSYQWYSWQCQPVGWYCGYGTWPTSRSCWEWPWPCSPWFCYRSIGLHNFLLHYKEQLHLAGVEQDLLLLPFHPGCLGKKHQFDGCEVRQHLVCLQWVASSSIVCSWKLRISTWVGIFILFALLTLRDFQYSCSQFALLCHFKSKVLGRGGVTKHIKSGEINRLEGPSFEGKFRLSEIL